MARCSVPTTSMAHESETIRESTQYDRVVILYKQIEGFVKTRKFVEDRNQPYLTVQIAPFPYGSISPATCQISFSFELQFLITSWQFFALGQITHNVEQPIAHTSREVDHLFFGAHLSRKRFQSFPIY